MNKGYRCMAICCNLIFVIIIIILINIIDIKSNDYEIFFKDTEDNHESIPYSSIKMSKQKCEKNEINLINYYIPKVLEHCQRSKTNAISGKCKRETNYIENYDEYSSQKIDHIFNVYFCGIPINTNYIEIQNSDDDNNCANGFKICGQDSVKNLCFPQDMECPLNDIIIINSQNNQLLNDGYSEQSIVNSLNETLYLYTTNKIIQNQIPIDFNFGFLKMCVDPDEHQTPKKQFQFFERTYLDECETSFEDIKYDYRYSSLYSINKKQFYQESGLLDKYKKYLSFDDSSLDYYLTFFKRPYIHFDDKCKEEFYNQDNDISLDELMLSESSYYKNSYIYHLVLTIVISFSSLIFIFFICVKSDKKIFIIQAIYHFIIFILSIPAIGLISHVFNKSKKRNRILDNAIDLQCGDEIFNFAIEYGFESINNTESIFISIISFDTFILVNNLGFGFLLCQAYLHKI